ncbi:MAG: CBS domain-containing protein [Coleofasciculaceae cyanobacterium SM2_3_26]|nr:CBS domain-containing protein [Coleofasciculaceae cyanobacterium SM2_3_26]
MRPGKLEGTVSFAAVCPYLPEKVLRSHVLADVLTDPVRIQARATIREATRLVVERDGYGALVETNTGECLGAIAAVDLLRFLAGRENFSAEKLDSGLPERGIRNVPWVPAKASLWEVRRDLGRGIEAIATDAEGVPLAIVEPSCLLYPFTPRALYELTPKATDSLRCLRVS